MAAAPIAVAGDNKDKQQPVVGMITDIVDKKTGGIVEYVYKNTPA
jgi:hypothetical protein